MPTLLGLALGGWLKPLFRLGVALLLALVVLSVLGAAIVGAVAQAVLAPFGGAPGAPAGQPIGPTYAAGTASLQSAGRPPAERLRLVSRRDLGYGPSDAARVDWMIAAIRPRSPLVGTGALILRLAQQYGVDPLLIAMWQLESQMATDGLNTPANGNWNSGNMIWEAAAPYADRWGCRLGGSSYDHRWAFCPSAESGLGIWYEYVGTAPVYARTTNLSEFVGIYNPCSDPWNARAGHPCGDAYGANLLAVLDAYAGPPVAHIPPAGGGDPCGPALPLVHAERNLVLPPAVAELMLVVFGGRQFPVTQGWGPSDFPGEPAWLGHEDFHAGLDFGAPEGTPVYAPVGGVARQTSSGGGGLVVELQTPDGGSWRFLHLSRQLAGGPVRRGDPIGLVGSTGYSTGPHLHLERRDAAGAYVAPEHWACRSGAAGDARPGVAAVAAAVAPASPATRALPTPASGAATSVGREVARKWRAGNGLVAPA